MPDVTRRMNYFDRQFLRAKDFQDEQAYHIDRRRRHNAGLHSSGVVEGLQVIPSGVANEVNIEAGWTVDALGREIVLATPRNNVPTGGADVEIWISYPDPEPLSAPSTDPGVTGFTRVHEEPVVTVVPPGTAPAGALLLATVSAADVINNDVRPLAGLKEGAVTEPKLADDAVSSRVIAEADAGTDQDADVGAGVKTPHLKDQAVTEPKLADDAVSNRTIQNDAVTGPKIAANQISTTHLQDDAVTAAKILDGSVESAELADGAVTEAKLEPFVHNGLVSAYCTFDGNPAAPSLLNHHNVAGVSKGGTGVYKVVWQTPLSDTGPVFVSVMTLVNAVPVPPIERFRFARLLNVVAGGVELVVYDQNGTPVDEVMAVMAFGKTGE